jgi:RHS repeat-associated protein
MFFYYPFGMMMVGRSFSSEGYRFGFNGKETENEVHGVGNNYDYGFRIYNTRLGKFLSIDPLYKSYPFYTPYQFAGNKPIAAVDLDGLEERIVIYYNTSDGRVKTTTIDYNTLMETVQLSGGYAMSKPITRDQFMAIKESYFRGFADNKSDFVSGHQQYTLGMSAGNKSGYIGPGKGTLTFGAGTNGTTIQYDPTPVQEKQESSFSIVQRNLQNPDARTKEAINTMKNYVAGVSLAVSLPAILTTAPSVGMIPEYLGAASSVDQLTGGNLTTTGNPQADQVINLVKVGVDIWSFKSGFNAIGNSTEAVPLMITGGSGAALDACDVVAPSNTK